MTEQTQTPRTSRAPRSRFDLRRPRVRGGAVIAIALLIGFVVWLALRDGSSSKSPVPPRATPTSVSAEDIKALADSLGHPIYWAGARSGYTYELTQTSDDRVFVRYLPSGASLGSDQPYLTIGTYPVKDAYTVVRDLSEKSGRAKVNIGNGGAAFYSNAAPTSVYFAYPGSDYQVEVYDPSATAARRLVTSGKVTAVGPGAAATSSLEAVSPSKLRTLASSLGHPVYWAGTRAGVTYELTKTSDGRVFVRYLPKGVKLGSNKPYLTVGTYPVTNAFAVTKGLTNEAGSVRVQVAGKGVAFFKKSEPTSVYVAYPGADLQIEVYDPSPARARALVASQRITPAG